MHSIGKIIAATALIALASGSAPAQPAEPIDPRTDDLEEVAAAMQNVPPSLATLPAAAQAAN